MMNSIVTYETQHGSAKRLAQIIAERLGCLCINVDTPFQAEDESAYDTLIMVFGFRGPYTAQLSKLFLSRMRGKLNYKHLIAVGEGLFSEMEFPSAARELQSLADPYSFNRFFMKGQLRVDTLTPEEQAILSHFSSLSGIDIVDMGEFDPAEAEKIAGEIEAIVNELDLPEDPNAGQTKWICSLCGYVHTGGRPPEQCPICGQPASMFKHKISDGKEKQQNE